MDQYENEDWVQYGEYPNYWVSSLGRVKRICKNGKVNIIGGSVSRKGYILVALSRRPVRVDKPLHVMVAECFLDNPDNKPMIDHINEDKQDNRLCNLRWSTNSENQRNITNLRTTNSSGCVGVVSRKDKNGNRRMWRVRISVNDQRIHIGDFFDFDDAVAARREAEIIHFGEFCPNR